MYSPTYTVKSAQNMRNRMTTAEGMLWKGLSNGFDNARFRRQYPIGNHVVDFYCRKLKLIIEISRVDCHVRKVSDVSHREASRSDVYLRACGYTVLRFTEKEITDDFSRIASKIALCVRFLGLKMKLSAVKSIALHAVEFAQSLFGPKRRLDIETSLLA